MPQTTVSLISPSHSKPPRNASSFLSSKAQAHLGSSGLGSIHACNADLRSVNVPGGNDVHSIHTLQGAERHAQAHGRWKSTAAVLSPAQETTRPTLLPQQAEDSHAAFSGFNRRARQRVSRQFTFRASPISAVLRGSAATTVTLDAPLARSFDFSTSRTPALTVRLGYFARACQRPAQHEKEASSVQVPTQLSSAIQYRVREFPASRDRERRKDN